MSEGDLLRRHEIGSDRAFPRGSWWMRPFQGEEGAADYVRSHAVRVADVMSQPVISVAEDADLRSIAALLGKRNIKRLPVMRGERLVGIVTRANIVQALAVASSRRVQRASAPTRTSAATCCPELGSRAVLRARRPNVLVTDGVVHYWGCVRRRGAEDRRARGGGRHPRCAASRPSHDVRRDPAMS